VHILVQSRKGVSTVLGATLMFILLLASFSILVWQFRQMDYQQQKANEKNKEQLERISESIEITDVKISSNQLNCSVLNKCSLTVHLVDLFHLAHTKQLHAYTGYCNRIGLHIVFGLVPTYQTRVWHDMESGEDYYS